MEDKTEHQTIKEEKTKTGFTGMPKDEPYPDFEPKNSLEKQHEQFEDTAENGKDAK